MEWTIISLVSLSLLGGIGGLLWRYFRGTRIDTTRHTVHCPLSDHSANLAVRTKFQSQGRRRHVDVTACSLHPQEPIIPPERVVWVPDLPYSDLRFEKGNPTPIHIGGVPCRKECLHILNLGEGHGVIGQKRCVFGVMDCPELAREAACKTAAESSGVRTPWSYV